MVFVAPEDYINATEDNRKFYKYKNKTPKNVLEFDDGILEEYSTDEDEDQVDAGDTTTPLNMFELTWKAWLIYKAHKAGTSTLACIDYLGDHLAWFFGITSPKYYFEIEESKRIKAAEEKEAEMRKSWQINNDDEQIVVDTPIKKSSSLSNNVV